MIITLTPELPTTPLKGYLEIELELAAQSTGFLGFADKAAVQERVKQHLGNLLTDRRIDHITAKHGTYKLVTRRFTNKAVWQDTPTMGDKAERGEGKGKRQQQAVDLSGETFGPSKDEPIRSTERDAAKRGTNNERSSRQLDLERQLFSEGPEIARADLAHLVSEMVARYPEQKSSLEATLFKAIHGGEESSANQVAEKKAPRRARTQEADLPRDGHPIIKELASLWDRREELPRPLFVQQFREHLEAFHKISTLDTFELNRRATAWVNRITSKSRLKLMLRGEQAVTIECANRGTGYFIPRTAEKNPQGIPGANSYQFPKLTAIAL